MAVISATFQPTSTDTSLSVGATSASAEQVVGGGMLAINANGDINIVFGPAGAVPTPTASNWRVPNGETQQFYINRLPSFKIYNPGASSVTVWYTVLAN